jgi:hypothetical protein
MSLRSFSSYHCLLALDPDEWPGEWESLLDGFPLLTSNRRTCFEFERETTVVVLGPDAQLMEEVVGFLDLVLSRQVPAPNGGVVFLDGSGQVFKTNWELRETWDWQIILQRLQSEESFLQCFAASGAIVEFRHVVEDIQVQDLDYEHPSGLEGSRADLQGVVLKNAGRFVEEVGGILDYLQALLAFAARIGKTASFANAFGLPPENSVDHASRFRQGVE